MTRNEHGTNTDKRRNRRGANTNLDHALNFERHVRNVVPSTRRSARSWTRRFKAVVFLAAVIPALQLLWRGVTDQLGANPIEAITLFTGRWTLRFLIITLAVTPVRRLTGWHEVIRYRRMLGLFAFFYATLHFATYIVLDQFFALTFIVQDIAKRPYITVGFGAFVLLVPLAVTSTAGWVRRLGRRWQLLHRLVYASAALGVVHFLWKVKADTRDPFIYGAIVSGLLAARVWNRVRTAGH